MIRQQFFAAIRAVGMTPPAHIESGRFYRFPGAGKGPRNTAGWCFLFKNGKGGIFGDFSRDLSEIWWANSYRWLSTEEKYRRDLEVREAKNNADLISYTEQHLAAKRAERIWRDARLAGLDHNYLTIKGITPYGTRQIENSIILPIINFNGQIQSLQFIAPDGSKKFLKGGRISGCFILVGGELDRWNRVIIAEGFATAATLAMEDPQALTLAAMTCENLKNIAMQARKRWPAAKLIIAGDDDRKTKGNPGRVAANDAAIAANALVVFPKWPDDSPPELTDFNDLQQWTNGSWVQ